VATDAGEADDREELYFEWGSARAVRTRRWKYIAFRHTSGQIADMESGRVEVAYSQSGEAAGYFGMHRYPGYWDPDQLYDLEADPDEQRNLAADPAHAGVLAEMRARLRGYLDRFDTGFDLAVDPFVRTPAYRWLVERTMADDSIYEFDWYVKDAY